MIAFKLNFHGLPSSDIEKQCKISFSTNRRDYNDCLLLYKLDTKRNGYVARDLVFRAHPINTRNKTLFRKLHQVNVILSFIVPSIEFVL